MTSATRNQVGPSARLPYPHHVQFVRQSKYSSSERHRAPESAPDIHRVRLTSALQHRAFRRVFAGSLASNIGTWMQNITLVALAYSLTRSAWFTGVITFAQLGPMLLLSPAAGALADRANRRTIMVAVAATQTVLSMVLAVVATDSTPSKVLLVLLVAGIGTGAAINGPAAGATLPSLVPREDLQSAIALNSAAMNASRVAGPILGGLVGTLGGAPLVFVVNGLTYLFVILAVCSVDVDFSPKGNIDEGPLDQLRRGLRAAKTDPVVSRVLVTISVLSLCSLVFVYQMPLLASRQLGLSGWRFNLLFACFALGAALGALSMGSFLSGHDRGRVARVALFVFAVSLAVFGTTHSPTVAFPAVFVLGGAYFVIITALSTTLQMQVADEVRGRIMGLWMMGWAGLVPLGSLIAGPVIDRTSISAVLVFGAVVALLLGLLVDLRRTPEHAPA